MTAQNVIEFVEHTLLPKLNPERTKAILAASRKADTRAANTNAHRAAVRAGRESEAIRFSERLRNATWHTCWEGTQVEALEISIVLARAGMAIATVDLVGDGEYSIEDYINLVTPWVSGFPDFPLPVKEEA